MRLAAVDLWRREVEFAAQKWALHNEKEDFAAAVAADRQALTEDERCLAGREARFEREVEEVRTLAAEVEAKDKGLPGPGRRV